MLPVMRCDTTNIFTRFQERYPKAPRAPLIYEFTRRRVILSAAGLPRKTVWLLIRRTLTQVGHYNDWGWAPDAIKKS